VSLPATVVFVALVTPPIPLMRTLSYYDLSARARLVAGASPPAAIGSQT
jgi:hypothetical protein